MRPHLLLLLPVLAALFLAPLLSSAPAQGDDDKETHYVKKRKPGRCLCRDGQASWEYLRSPMRPPADPPRCGLLIANGDCASKDRPRGTSGVCWGSQKKECFFKRHAYSYGIQCSECWKDESCDACDELIGGRDPKVLATLERQLKIEGHGKKHKYVLAVTRHFYVLTDIDKKMKIKTKGGAPRVASAHEVAHLYAERCEAAYNDFAHYFKGRIRLAKPMGVYITLKHRTAEAFAQSYLGSANTDMVYGASDNSRVAKGFCGNGFVGSLQEQRSDVGLHGLCRHMIGHLLFSCWIHVDPSERACPKWAFVGAAHFLEKLPEPQKDYATFCSNETTAPSGSGKDWYKKSRSLAARKLDPIETFFARDSLGHLSYNDHIRAWSIMDLMLREDNARWLDVLKSIRYKNDEGVAFKDVLGITPDDFHKRWKARLTGGRKTMGEVRADSEDPDAPGRRERGRIQSTEDADVLAGLIRGVDRIEDVRMAEVVVGRLDHPSDLVRETILNVLSQTEADDVLAWLRTEGLDHKKKLARAGVARALGMLKHAPARERLEAMLKDSFWLAKANAAFALGEIGDDASFAPLVAALSERKPKTWMCIADACATFGTRSDEASLKTIERINHGSWQVRLTVARALAAYGTDNCMDGLIARYSLERGRLEREYLRALRAVSGDDLGKNAATWEKWWKGQKEKHGGFDPNRPPPPNPADARYADPKGGDKDEPHYYGRRIFSRSVGFVFDVSSSMEKNITIPKGASTKLGDIPLTGTRMMVAKEVLAGTIKSLKPQVRFNLVFFSTDVRPWKKNLVPASQGNVNAAASAVLQAPANGETNIHGALKAALGLHDKPTLSASLDNIPDTVYFLTDGSPTRGEITSTPELLGWFRNLNRFAKVKLHVVAFGNLGVDLEFLRKLAAIGGGDFIHVPEE